MTDIGLRTAFRVSTRKLAELRRRKFAILSNREVSSSSRGRFRALARCVASHARSIAAPGARAGFAWSEPASEKIPLLPRRGLGAWRACLSFSRGRGFLHAKRPCVLGRARGALLEYQVRSWALRLFVELIRNLLHGLERRGSESPQPAPQAKDPPIVSVTLGQAWKRCAGSFGGSMPKDVVHTVRG